jgi:hypothetical protein
MDNVSCEKYHVRSDLSSDKAITDLPRLVQVQRGAGTKWDTLVQASDDLRTLKKAMIDAGFTAQLVTPARISLLAFPLVPISNMSQTIQACMIL